MRMRTAVLVLVVTALVLALTGCAQLAQQAIEKSTGVSVDKNGNKVTVTGPNGQQTTVQGGKNELPADLPSSIPIYNGATVKASATIAAEKTTNYTISLETSDDVATVASWYKTELTGKGWTMKTVAAVAQAAVLTGTNGASKIEVTIGKVSGGDQTAIVIVAQMAK
jgi:hypothetical protein